MEYRELKLTTQFDKSVVCTFTGNRPKSLPWESEMDERAVAVKERLRVEVERAINSGKILFVCGMAEGADMYFCETVIALKEKYPHILLEGALPYPEPDKYRSDYERARYARAIEKCDFVSTISPVGSKFAPLKRNRYMVDKSSLLFALNYSDRGGTVYTMDYAKQKGVEIIKINK